MTILLSLTKALVMNIDFSKAFDKVDHGVLLHKLLDLKIKGEVGSWIAEFLSRQRQFVRVQSHESSMSDVISSVPQGTVLGPALFLILMLDINAGVKSNIICFADDTRLLRAIKSDQDIAILQDDLVCVYNWAITNNMKFNDSKFQYINFNCSKESIPRKYLDPSKNIINKTKQVQDLGITLSANCEFKAHINNVVKKCYKLSGWILRTFMSRDRMTMLTLWKALVLPRLDYCSQLWSPSKAGEINTLENIQRQFTRYIDNLNGCSYPERLKSLHLYSLERRRDRYTIIYLWKILEGKVPNLTNPIKATYSTRRGRSCVINSVPRGNAGSLLYNSFRCKAVRLFNCIPRDVRNASQCSVNIFKSKLDAFLNNLDDIPGRPEGENSLVKTVERWRRTLRVGPAK